MVNKEQSINVLIDESGTLPDSSNKIVVLAAVGTEGISPLSKVMTSIKSNLKDKKNSQEIKFYTAGEKTKNKIIAALLNVDVSLFVLVIEKDIQKIQDTPQNFAVLAWILLSDCIFFYPHLQLNVIFDKHFHRKVDQEEFNNHLLKLLSKEITISHVDSRKFPSVNAADIIAGSVLWAKTGKDKTFYEKLSKKITSERTINWKDLKRLSLKRDKSI